jgi:hypothetical protein
MRSSSSSCVSPFVCSMQSSTNLKSFLRPSSSSANALSQFRSQFSHSMKLLCPLSSPARPHYVRLWLIVADSSFEEFNSFELGSTVRHMGHSDLTAGLVRVASAKALRRCRSGDDAPSSRSFPEWPVRGRSNSCKGFRRPETIRQRVRCVWLDIDRLHPAGSGN